MGHISHISGFEGLHRLGATKNYHVADKNGRAYFCGCFKSMWVNITIDGQTSKRVANMDTLKGCRKNRLNSGYRLYQFQRNLLRNRSGI